MKVMWFGQSPRYQSGMGKVGRKMAKHLAMFHDVHYYAHSGAESGERFKGFTLYGNQLQDQSGQQMFPWRLNQINPDALVSNLNWQSLVWLHNPLNQKYMNTGENTKVVLYTPVETEEKPPFFEKKLLDQHLNPVYLIPFGKPQYERMSNDWGLEEYVPNPKWVPHGVDRAIFYPREKEAQSLRQQLGIGDDFVVGFCGENWRRKNHDIMCQAFKRFSEDKEDVSLIMHTSPQPTRGNDPFFSGWGMNALLDHFNLKLNKDVYVTKQNVTQFVPEDKLATIYSALDIYVLPTSGESFSLTSLEAMSCGTPCIHTDLENLKWLCADASLYAGTRGKRLMRTGESLPIPDVDELVEKMQELYENQDQRKKMAKKGIKRAKDFSWKKSGKELTKILNKISE